MSDYAVCAATAHDYFCKNRAQLDNIDTVIGSAFRELATLLLYRC